MKSLEIYKFLKAKLRAGIWLNDFHLNDNFLEFADKFYQNKPIRTAMKSFNRYMRILVQDGLCSKSSGSYKGIINEFGRRKINNYIPK